jgi:hypothetical protein
MAVNPDRTAVNNYVSLDQCQVNIKRFWVARERRF